MTMFLLSGAVLWAGLGLTAVSDRSVPLRVTEPVGLDRVNAPVCGGVPLGPLAVTNAGSLRLYAADGEAVPAQISPLVTREDGTLAWVLVDFLTNLRGGEIRGYTLSEFGGAGTPLAIRNAVQVQVSDEKVVLGNGLIKIEMPTRKFNLFRGVWLDPRGEGAFKENVLAAEQPAAFTLVRGKDKATFSSRDGRVENVTLEDPGPVRTTVRVDGDYGDGKGANWLKYTVRITLWAGSTDVRVLYAIRNVNPELDQQEQIRKAVVALRLLDKTGIKDYLVGGGMAGMGRLTQGEQGTPKGSQWHHTVRLSQVGPPEPVLSKTHRTFYKLCDFEQPGFRVEHFQPGDRRPFVDVGYQCKGWIDLMGDSGGCLFFCRAFAYDVPKAMEVRQDGTMTLDVIPEYEGKNQPYYADGGYWLGDRTYRTYDLYFRFHDKPFLTEADWKQWGERMVCYTPPTDSTAATLDGIVERLKNPLPLVSTPDWYTRSGELWGEVPSQEDEAVAAKAMGFAGVKPARPDPRHDLVLDFLHYENFHYRSEWDEPGDSILEFVRTGQWNHWRRARAFGDNYRDLGVPRTDGMKIGPRGKGAQGAGPILRWGKFCDCHKYGSGLIDLWLITGDRSYRDAGLDFGYDEAVERPRWAGFGNRDWGRQMTGVLRTYMVTRDPKLKAYLLTYCTPRVPDEKLRVDGRAMICGLHQSSWMTALCSHAVWHNWVLHQDQYQGVDYDDYRDQIVGMARQVARWWFSEEYKSGPYNFDFDTPKPGDIKINGGGAAYTASCVDMITRGYLLTRDPKLLAAAVKFWKSMNPKDEPDMVVRLQDFQGMGSNTGWCRQLIYTLAHPPSDRTAPEKVIDLKAEALGGGKVKLTWTAPRDAEGKVLSYQVKHAPCPIVSFEEYQFPLDQGKKWSWWAGYNVVGEPEPGAPGTSEGMTAENVPVGERHFALVSRDADSNESEISNVVCVEVR